jgi:hypothetical protein
LPSSGESGTLIGCWRLNQTVGVIRPQAHLGPISAYTNSDKRKERSKTKANVISDFSVADFALLHLAGVSAVFAIVIRLYIVVVAPVRATIDAIGTGIAWLTGLDMRWLPKTLMAGAAVILSVAFAGLAAIALSAADPVAEIIFLVVVAVALTIAAAFLVSWIVSFARKAARTVIRPFKR